LSRKVRSDIEMTVFANVRSFAENPQNDVDALNSMLDVGKVRFLVNAPADRPNLVAFDEIDDDQNCRGLFITPMQLVQLC